MDVPDVLLTEGRDHESLYGQIERIQCAAIKMAHGEAKPIPQKGRSMDGSIVRADGTITRNVLLDSMRGFRGTGVGVVTCQTPGE